MNRKCQIIHGVSLSLVLLFCMVFLVGACMAGCSRKTGELEEAGYQGILLSTYDMDSFSEESFLTYRGLKVSVTDRAQSDWNALVSTLKRLQKENAGLQNVYLGLHPAEDKDIEYYKELVKQIRKYPETTYEILLASPSGEYWCALSEAEREALQNRVVELVKSLEGLANVYVYFMGEQEWLVANPDNYISLFGVNGIIADKMICATFCDRLYTVDAAGYIAKMQKLRDYVTREAEKPSVYPDLNGYRIVFLGDSIMGNYEGSYSIPGVVAALSGAETYNCGVGGVAAATIKGARHDAVSMAKDVIGESDETSAEKSTYIKNAEAFRNHGDSDANTVFFLEYGINDFLEQTMPGNSETARDNTTYYGALYESIRLLKEAYPEALVCVLGPTYVYDSQGREQELVLYRETAEIVANDMEVTYLDMYSLLAADEAAYAPYLEDECHLNAEGRYQYARILLSYLALEQTLAEE